ncbi:MAG: hypothetical protein GY761_16285 [Hyphomicrobiales bacterium]|nr:hypothetical protein [Hyphomicrobiales bacterium]
MTTNQGVGRSNLAERANKINNLDIQYYYLHSHGHMVVTSEGDLIEQKQDLVQLGISGDEALIELEALVNKLDETMKVVSEPAIRKEDKKISLLEPYEVSAEAASFVLENLSDILLDISDIPTKVTKPEHFAFCALQIAMFAMVIRNKNPRQELSKFIYAQSKNTVDQLVCSGMDKSAAFKWVAEQVSKYHSMVIKLKPGGLKWTTVRNWHSEQIPVTISQYYAKPNPKLSLGVAKSKEAQDIKLAIYMANIAFSISMRTRRI